MEYLVIGLAAIGLLVFKGIRDKKTYKRKLRQMLEESFGAVSEEEYTSEKFQAIRKYYNAVKRPKYDVDDITWNDLELDELYMTMNQTVSAMGEEYLYAMLRMPEFSSEELCERERLISLFCTEKEKRIALQEALYQIGKSNRYSVFECMRQIQTIKRESNLFHVLSSIALVLSIGLAFLKPQIGVIATCLVITYNIYSYMKRKGELDAYLSSVIYLIRLLYAVEDVGKLNIPELSVYTDRMKELNRHFGAFKRNFWIIGSRKPTGDMLDMFVSYFRMLFHIDLIKFNRMLKIYDKHLNELNGLYEIVGYLDALCSAASFRVYLGNEGGTVPELVEEGPVYEVKELYHPLLNEPVKNSITTGNSVLLTGSNASGKSTFLKSVAMGALLAQTVHTVPAKSYRASYYQILSSMALRDNMQNNESYFIVEIKSLKRIYEAAKEPVYTLCFVDEVLRGTNTVERIAASREVLEGLAGMGRTICFAATHDIELTYLLETIYENYHFEETVTDHQVEFDYLLHKGRASSRNAIKLLRMLGYPVEVTERAEASAERFLQTGEWS